MQVRYTNDGRPVEPGVIIEGTKMSPEDALEQKLDGYDVAVTRPKTQYGRDYTENIEREVVQEMITWNTKTRQDFDAFQEKRQKRRNRRDICTTTVLIWFMMLGVAVAIACGYVATRLNSYEGWLAWLGFPVFVIAMWQYLRTHYKINGDLLD